MNRVALVGKRGKTEAVALARLIAEHFTHLELLLEGWLAEALGWPVPADDREVLAKAELVVVLGGDGTMIHAARLLRGREVPILGVNLGTLGFMTEVDQAELLPTLSRVLAGQFRTEARMKLGCRLWRDDRLVVEEEVLNDVVINKGALARIADHEVSIDGEHVSTYKADGVIVATPTGSTAYSLSAGGPIVHARLDAVVISPICPHGLTQRSIVVPSDRVVQVVLRSEISDVYLTLDGQVGHALRSGDRIEVVKAPTRLVLIRDPSLSYFAILRRKLHWGER